MAKIISEVRNIKDNTFEYEKRLQSPYNRLIDKAPTPVTYFHINDNESTVNEGYQDIEEIIGPKSPLRFDRIEGFPLYGVPQINPNIQEDDQGINITFEAECFVLPHTVKPNPNDFFLIDVLDIHDVYIFKITDIAYDNIHPDNFYKTQFRLELTSKEKLAYLEKQVINNYTCIIDNIGTDSHCIIETDKFTKYQKVKDTYDDLVNLYVSIFYNEKYNCFLGEYPCNKKLYDPYMVEFVNKWNLFNSKDKINSLIISQEIDDNKFKLKYEKSVWRFIEKNDYSLLNKFIFYTYRADTLKYTTFSLYRDATVNILDIPLSFYSDTDTRCVFNDEFINTIKDNKECKSSYGNLLKKYILKEKLDINSVPLDINETLYSLEADVEFFFITPMILYIMKKIMKDSFKYSISYNTMNDNKMY